MIRRRPLCSSVLSVVSLVVLAGTAAAQGPQEWIKRIFEPEKLGVTMPPDATMNRKLTVDYLSKTDPPKQIAIYMMPIDQLKTASDYFKGVLHADPAVTGSGQYEIHRFDITSGKAKGLTITLTRSQFVDSKLQITMEYLPPK